MIMEVIDPNLDNVNGCIYVERIVSDWMKIQHARQEKRSLSPALN